MPIFLKFKAALDDSAFMAGMRRINTAAGRMARGVGRGVGGAGRLGGGFIGIGAGSLGLAAAGMGARAIMRDADALFNLSRKTGMSTRSLAALAEMGAGANIEMEQLASSAALMSANLGTNKGQKAINDIGLSLEELQSIKPEEQFFKIGKAIASIDDQTKKVGAARAIFGRSASDLFELFDDLGKMDMSRVSDNAKKMGDSAKDIADANDKLAAMGVGIKATGAQAMAALLRGDFQGAASALLNDKSKGGLFKPEEVEIAAREPFKGFKYANRMASEALGGLLYNRDRLWDEVSRDIGGGRLGATGGLGDTDLGTHGRVSRGDRKRAQARERLIEKEFKEAVARKKLLEEIKEKMEAIADVVTKTME